MRVEDITTDALAVGSDWNESLLVFHVVRPRRSRPPAIVIPDRPSSPLNELQVSQSQKEELEHPASHNMTG